jgi:hypothetical protein
MINELIKKIISWINPSTVEPVAQIVEVAQVVVPEVVQKVVEPIVQVVEPIVVKLDEVKVVVEPGIGAKKATKPQKPKTAKAPKPKRKPKGTM